MLLHIIGWDGLNSYQVFGLSICESKHLKLFKGSNKTIKKGNFMVQFKTMNFQRNVKATTHVNKRLTPEDSHDCASMSTSLIKSDNLTFYDRGPSPGPGEPPTLHILDVSLHTRFISSAH